MAKRVKAPSLSDRDAFVATVDAVADLQTQIELIQAREARALQRVQSLYAAKLEPLQEEQKALVSLAEKYADTHRADLLPKDRKSAETGLATFGWRTGNPAVKTIGKVKWDAIAVLLQARNLLQFLRTVVEVNKEALLAAWRKADGVLVLRQAQPAKDGQEAKPEIVIAPAALGLRIDQPETFYIAPKVETSEPVKAA
jgi:phage host-nuclease inhibitor protein Gam